MSPYFFAGLVFMAALTFSADAQEKPTAREPAPPIAWHATDHKANATLASEQLWPPWPMGLAAIAFSDAPGLCAISWFKFVEDSPGLTSYQIVTKNLFEGLPERGILGDYQADGYSVRYVKEDMRLADFLRGWAMPATKIRDLRARLGLAASGQPIFASAPAPGFVQDPGSDEAAFLRWFFAVADPTEITVAEIVEASIDRSGIPKNQRVFSMTDPDEIARFRARSAQR